MNQYGTLLPSRIPTRLKPANVKTRLMLHCTPPGFFAVRAVFLILLHPYWSPLFPKLNLLLTCRIFSSKILIFMPRIVILLFCKVALNNPEISLLHTVHLFLCYKSPRKYSSAQMVSCLLPLSAFAFGRESQVPS